MDWWWQQFSEVIQQWILNDPQSMKAWHDSREGYNFALLRDMAQWGQIASGSSDRAAVWEAFLYQRLHADALKAVLEVPLRSFAADGQHHSIGIVDIGCGTGTAAFAFHEIFDGDVTIHYVGIDHHEGTRRLCTEMIEGGIVADGGTFTSLTPFQMDSNMQTMRGPI